jgi:hypothetical protein
MPVFSLDSTVIKTYKNIQLIRLAMSVGLLALGNKNGAFTPFLLPAI